MTQAMKNVQSAVRTELTEVYKKQFELSAQKHLREDWIRLNLTLPSAEGILVYNNDGKLTFPVFNAAEPADGSAFKEAHALEYRERTYEEALNEYRRIAEVSDGNDIRIIADIAQARCLSKLKRPQEAINQLHTIISRYRDQNVSVQTHKCHAFLMSLDLTAQSDSDQFAPLLETFYDFATRGMATDNDLQFLGESDFISRAMPSETQLFALTRFLDYAAQLPSQQEIDKKIKRANRLIQLIKTSIDIAQEYPTPAFINSSSGPNSTFRLTSRRPFYGHYIPIHNHIRLSAFSRNRLAGLLTALQEDIKTFPADCAIYDETGQRVMGTALPNGQPAFIRAPVGDWLPGWSVHLYIENTTFEKFADKQETVYLWTGVLVAVLVTVTGIAAVRTVGQQIRTNRLKNDFIATVTHELKTPLASMRVLVDTLLDKRYTDEATADEYLRMIAGENKRLTHLIDSFLTFSRMERNKQVFDFQAACPAEIAAGAVEAMSTKLLNHKCDFRADIDESLPAVSADRDAMVTVLVNLLDNACKYGKDDRRIQLRVYAENGSVCFAVEDNGIGITRRQQKKIFTRFYQADSRLSRSVEGCGLGLSIVKFIVDAHKGTIEVDSTPGKGSVFTVKIASLQNQKTNC